MLPVALAALTAIHGMSAVTGKPPAAFTSSAAIAVSQTHSPAKHSLAPLVDPDSVSTTSLVLQTVPTTVLPLESISPSSNNLLTDIRFGYYRYDIVTAKYDQGVDFANQVGIPGLNTGTSYTSGSPAFEIDQNSSNGFLGSGLNVNRCNCQLTEKEQQGQIVNNWTKILGNHAFKFGADLRYATNLRVPSDSNRTGQLVFQNGQTSNPSLSSPGGLGWASFSLGNVQAYQRYVSVSTNAKEDQKRFFFYGQDTWRLTPALTLNLGLRYEFWYPESVNAKGNGSLMNLNTGYLQVAGYGNIPSNMGWERQKNTWSPRIGLAYQLDPKTVIRSGYGRSFDIGVFGSIFGHVVTQNLPVLANQSLSGSGDATTFAFNLADGPAEYVFPTVPDNGLLPVPGYQINAKTRPNPLLLPTVDAWNLSIQRSITSTLSTTIAYVGNKSTHTLGAGDSNNTNPNESAINLPSQYSVTGEPTHWDPSVAGGLIAPDGGTSTSKFLQRFYGGSLAACQGADYQLAMRAAVNDPLLPAGACGWNQGVSNYSDNLNAEFDALQVTIAKQFSKGNSFNINYSWNRGWDENSGYSTWNVAAGRGRNNDVREQQLVAYGVYEVPFGKNRFHRHEGNCRWMAGFSCSELVERLAVHPYLQRVQRLRRWDIGSLLSKWSGRRLADAPFRL